MYSAILETPRLILNGVSPANIADIFNNFREDEIKQILGHQNEKEFLLEKEKNEKGYASYNRTFILFLMIDKTTNWVIGRCAIHNWNKDHRRGEIGYNLSIESYKNQGYMTEALEAVIQYAFEELKLHRLEAMVSPNNIPSLKLIKRFGFTEEGRLREHYLTDGVFEDSIFFSKLLQEYKRS